MWLYLKIKDKYNKINHEPILFNTDDYEVIIQDEKEEKIYFNSEQIGDNNASQKMDKNNTKIRKKK